MQQLFTSGEDPFRRKILEGGKRFADNAPNLVLPPVPLMIRGAENGHDGTEEFVAEMHHGAVVGEDEARAGDERGKFPERDLTRQVDHSMRVDSCEVPAKGFFARLTYRGHADRRDFEESLHNLREAVDTPSLLLTPRARSHHYPGR